MATRVYCVMHTKNLNENHFEVIADSITEARAKAIDWVLENTEGYTFLQIWKWRNMSGTNYDFMDISIYVNQKGKLAKEVKDEK